MTDSTNPTNQTAAEAEPMGHRTVKDEVRIQIAIVSAAARGATADEMIAALDALHPATISGGDHTGLFFVPLTTKND